MDQHAKQYERLNIEGENYLRKQNTLDAQRHLTMLEPINQFIEKGDTWLTVGDGRYGTEAQYLQSQGIKVIASDLNVELLKKACEAGVIKEYLELDAEAIRLADKQVDFILIKETLHHCR